MKRIFTCIAMAFTLAIGAGFANQAELFTVNETELSSRFDGLASIENELEGISDANSFMLSNPQAFYSLSNNAAASGFTMADMDWGAFAWGFCCCPIGFFVVAISKEKDNNSKTSYWIGVVVSAVLSAVSRIANPGMYAY